MARQCPAFKLARRSLTLALNTNIYVVVNFLSQVIFIFPLFLGMVIYANEFETKEKQILPEIKNYLQHIHCKYVFQGTSPCTVSVVNFSSQIVFSLDQWNLNTTMACLRYSRKLMVIVYNVCMCFASKHKQAQKRTKKI